MTLFGLDVHQRRPQISLSEITERNSTSVTIIMKIKVSIFIVIMKINIKIMKIMMKMTMTRKTQVAMARGVQERLEAVVAQVNLFFFIISNTIAFYKSSS